MTDSTSPEWYAAIRQIHQRGFEEDWQRHVDQLNTQFRLAGKSRLMLPHLTLPPPWFNGDIERLPPNRWVLVVSLNPHIDPNDTSLDRYAFSPQAWWDFWRGYNLGDRWKGAFFPRLTRLAAACLGESLPTKESIKRFASERILFVEFCPYASERFTIGNWSAAKYVADNDKLGFTAAREIRQAIFDRGQPALVLCNGKFATYDVKDHQCGHMERVRITALDDERLSMSIWSAFFSSAGRTFPVVGFNQLGRRGSSPAIEAALIERFVRQAPLRIQALSG